MIKCANPFYHKSLELYFPCRKCVPCSIIRKMEWVTRLTLEATRHVQSCFVTLTYNDDNLVYGGTDQPTLMPDDPSMFIKRLRSYLSYHGYDNKIRYFVCGEYGTKSKRPHYHLLLFGIDSSFDSVISNCWDKGFTMTLPVKKGAIEYCAGYCVKNLEHKEWIKDAEVHPEFFRSSVGMGSHIIKEVAEQVKKYSLPDSPRFVHVGKKKNVSNCLLDYENS